MSRIYKSAPLPFMGQKRYFVRAFSETLGALEGKIDTVVDLFGGSGLLSHTAKKVLPGCRVIYNDYDGYSQRLAHVEQTNEILMLIKERLKGVQSNARLSDRQRADVLAIVEKYEAAGYVDVMTIGRSVLFSGKWVKTLDELRKHTMYNRVKTVPVILTVWKWSEWITGNCLPSIRTTAVRCSCWIRRILLPRSANMRTTGGSPIIWTC